MREADLTEWLNNPVTVALVAHLRQRRAGAVTTFLQGQPVDPVTQGRAAALYELHQLLTSPSDDVRKVFDNAMKENRKL